MSGCSKESTRGAAPGQEGSRLRSAASTERQPTLYWPKLSLKKAGSPALYPFAVHLGVT